MRRMRDHWYYLLLGVPAAAVTFGIQYYVKKHSGSAAPAETAEIASTAGDHGAGDPDEKHAAAKLPDPAKIARRVARKADDHDDAEAPHGSLRFKTVPARALFEASEPRPADNGVCRSIEYRGEGPVFSNYRQHEWDRVLTQFREVKTALIEWVEKRRTDFPEKTAGLMIRQIERTRIQRPPALEEPDLTWRGIGVLSQTYKGEPLIRLGGGMIQLAQKYPARAKFELARLVAQSWSPCEMQKLEIGGAWDPLMKCLGVQDQGCDVGTYSESGWAVSSTIAAAVAEPGCRLPAFEDATAANCLKAIPLPPHHASIPPKRSFIANAEVK